LTRQIPVILITPKENEMQKFRLHVLLPLDKTALRATMQKALQEKILAN